MKPLLYLSFLLMPALCGADTFILKDGARLEGEVTGELENALQVKTKYGQLTINKEDIAERQAAPQAPAPAPAEPAALSSAPASVEVSSEPAVEISTPQPEGVVEAAPRLTFQTIQPSTMTRLLVYFENGVAAATETVTGGVSATEGVMPDGTYTEYYPEGGLKTVKTMMAGKANGTMKAYYPSGTLQAEAYYLAGGKEGPLKYYTEEGKVLMQADYRNDQLNGWKRDYGPDGAVLSETYYAEDKPAAAPRQSAPAEKAALPARPESPVTVTKLRLARGERFTFRLNGKYAARAHLDKDYNLIGLSGKVPDGEIKVYTADGRLEQEFVFEQNVLKTLRVYEPGGPLKAEYAYEKDKAVKK